MTRRSLMARVRRRFRRPTPVPAVSASPDTPSQPVEVATALDLTPLTQLRDALWGGVVGDARARLEALVDDETSALAGEAAHELATWALSNGHVDAAGSWVGHLDAASAEQAVVMALTAQAQGDVERACAVLDTALASQPDDPHLQLHRANHEPVGRRLDVINELFTQAGCSAVDLTGVAEFADLPVLPTLRAPRQVADPATTPLVTVIVPVFQAAETIAQALGSLQAQTYNHLQIIVVDDASGDDTSDIVRQLARDDTRLSLVRQSANRGPFAARNAGLDRATGAFVTVHQGDQWAHRERLDRQVRHLLAHPDVVANTTQQIFVDSQLHLQPNARHPYELLVNNPASLMVRREIFSVVGPWDAGVRVGADIEFVKRLEARFGSPAVAHLLRRTPLTMSLRHPVSAALAEGTGVDSQWNLYGAHRQYVHAYTAWHRSERFARDLPWRSNSARPFPAPLVLTGAPGGSFVDVVVRGDLSPGASGVADAVTQVVRAAGAGRSLALWHEPHALEGLGAGLDGAIMRLLADQRARLLSAGEQVRCQNLITVGRPSALGTVEGAPQVTVVPW